MQVIPQHYSTLVFDLCYESSPGTHRMPAFVDAACTQIGIRECYVFKCWYSWMIHVQMSVFVDASVQMLVFVDSTCTNVGVHGFYVYKCWSSWMIRVQMLVLIYASCNMLVFVDTTYTNIEFTCGQIDYLFSNQCDY